MTRPPVSFDLQDALAGLPGLRPHTGEFTAAECAQWDRLAMGDRSTDPTCGAHAWQITSFQHATQPGYAPILRQTAAGQLSMIFVALEQGVFGVSLEPHWTFGQALLGQEGPALLSDTLFEIRERLPGRRITVIVGGGRENCPRLGALREACPIVTPLVYDRHVAASLDGGLDGWLSRRSGGFRKSLRKTGARAAAAGVVFERVIPRTLADAQISYTRMLDVEARSWKGDVGSGLFSMDAFYDTLMAKTALAGQARILFARWEGEDVGFCYGKLIDGHYRGHQTSYSEDVGALGVGTLMHYETARWLTETGAHTQHFGPVQPGLEYKHRLGEEVIECHGLRVDVEA